MFEDTEMLLYDFAIILHSNRDKFNLSFYNSILKCENLYQILYSILWK